MICEYRKVPLLCGHMCVDLLVSINLKREKASVCVDSLYPFNTQNEWPISTFIQIQDEFISILFTYIVHINQCYIDNFYFHIHQDCCIQYIYVYNLT